MSFSISRRAALAALMGGGAAACKPRVIPHIDAATRTVPSGAFQHGVASGDPLQDRVIIWTRFTRQTDNMVAAPDIMIVWEVAKDLEFENIVRSGDAIADSVHDWTVKVDVEGLEPGNWYYYRFRQGNKQSPIGRTRTLPKNNIDQVRFAVVSCCNLQDGYFNVYDHIARVQTDGHGEFDALLHLGDYFYEYGPENATTAMKAEGRLHEPPHEIIALKDYRTRHAQYRGDANLQAVTAQMPMISIWDDHESANDSHHEGAQNHQAGEGSWEVRKERALRAYYEWMPLRNPEPGRGREFLFRSFEWGDLATVAAIETRLLARSVSFEFEDYYDDLFDEERLERLKQEKWLDPNREMMGELQVNWLADVFGNSKDAGKPWRLLANQVLMARIITPDMTPYISEAAIPADAPYRDIIIQKLRSSTLELPLYTDSWDGYPAARERFYAALSDRNVDDILVVTGDAHEFFACDLTTEAGTPKGVEICTSSVSSETRGDVLGDSASEYALLVNKENPDVKYYNPMNQGYVDLTLTPNKAHVRMIGVDTVKKPQYTAFRAADFTIEKSGESLKISNPEGLALAQQALFYGG